MLPDKALSEHSKVEASLAPASRARATSQARQALLQLFLGPHLQTVTTS